MTSVWRSDYLYSVSYEGTVYLVVSAATLNAKKRPYKFLGLL